MRILQVIPTIDLRRGGSVIACLSLCRELARRGAQVLILSTDEGRTGDISHDPKAIEGVGVRTYRAYNMLYGLSPGLFRALVREVPAADVVHIHSLYRFSTVAAAALCWYYQVPYVIKPHGSLDPFLFRVKRWRKAPLERLLLAPVMNGARAIQFTADEEMILAASTGLFKAGEAKPIFNAETVPEGHDVGELDPDGTTEIFHAAFPETREKRILLFLSRLNFKKGLDILIEAFRVIAQKHHDVHLVLAGPDTDNYSQQVREWLRKADLSDRVTFTGMLTGALRSAAYRAADVFALPSYTENFGLVVVEALGCGIPVVISNRINIWREVETAGAGIVVDCDSRQTAEGILKILDDPGLARKLGASGKRLVLDRFNWRIVGDQMIDLYRRAIEAGDCAGRGLDIQSTDARSSGGETAELDSAMSRSEGQTVAAERR